MTPQAKELPDTGPEARDRSFSHTFTGSMATLTLWSWTSRFQNCETMHFYCLNHSTCGTLVQQPQQRNTAHLLCVCWQMASREKNNLLWLRSLSKYWIKFLSLPEKVTLGETGQELPDMEFCCLSKTVQGPLHVLMSSPLHS